MRTIIAALTIGIIACQSVPTEVPELEPKEYFQRAQEAVVERGDYNTALFYYQTFLERHSDQLQLSVEAEYEIAFIHYKLGDEALARGEFAALLEKHRGDVAQVLPRWPMVLSENVLSEMDLSVTAEE